MLTKSTIEFQISWNRLIMSIIEFFLTAEYEYNHGLQNSFGLDIVACISVMISMTIMGE